MIQTKARGETGAMMEGMVGEKGILPERSEWFRSTENIGNPGKLNDIMDPENWTTE